MRITSCPCLLTAILAGALAVSAAADAAKAGAERPRARVVPPAGRQGGELASHYVEALARVGYATEVLQLETFLEPTTDLAGQCELLLLCDGGRLPSNTVPIVERYLASGGDLIVFQAPLWREMVVRHQGEWLSARELQSRWAGRLPEHVVAAFEEGSLDGWTRSSVAMDMPVTYETVSQGPAPGQRALHFEADEIGSWDTLGVDAATPFPGGNTLTVFSAKGSVNTRNLSVEWRERDGSRWIATVPLSDDWRLYVLPPESFAFWESVPARKDTTLNPQDAVNLTIGLAMTHTGPPTGAQEYWVGPVGSAAGGSDFAALAQAWEVPPLDQLAPRYKFFDVTRADQFVISPHQAFVPEHELPFAHALEVRSPHPRPQPGGFDKRRPYRWTPLIEARTAGGEWAGTPATLLVNAEGPYKGGVWAAFAVDERDWYQHTGVFDLVTAVAGRMREGVFLLDAGAENYTYFEDQVPRYGARVLNFSPEPKRVTVRLRALDAGTGEVLAESQEIALDCEPGALAVTEAALPRFDWPEGGARVETALRRGDETIDYAAHPMHVWRAPAKPDYVRVVDGDFYLNDRPWRPHGVNYMPSSGVAIEYGEHFEYWLDDPAYDPKVIARDLDHVKEIGLNAVSVFCYHRSMEDQNFLDLLRQVEERGLKANVSLRPGTPMDLPWDTLRQLIEYYRLPENDAVMAYDIAWEPLWRPSERAPWDDDWHEWVVERYGGVEAAEKDWGFEAARGNNGQVAAPRTEQVMADGPWRAYVAAYRRFLDTVLYAQYSRARDLVETIDPHHPVSFRMSMAGDPTLNAPAFFAYDFSYLGGAVDIFEPEGYGRVGDWERVKPGRFTFEYARWANPQLPVLWAEGGVHVWDMGMQSQSPQRLEFQAQLYRDLYRMVLESGADGIFWWWYPGGFRVGENSDYGIINPDGSDRPVTRVIREHVDAMRGGPKTPEVDRWLEFDRDAHPTGIYGVYQSVKDAFWAAIERGEAPGLRTAATGSDTSEFPMAAVGNTPLTGSNPPKHLDAYFDSVWVHEGVDWRPLRDGDAVDVPPQGLRVMAVVRNLGETAWLPDNVNLRVEGVTPRSQRILRRVDQFEATGESVRLNPGEFSEDDLVTLTMELEGVTRFGQRFEIRRR